MRLRLLLAFAVLAGTPGCSLGTLLPSFGQSAEATPPAAVPLSAPEADPLYAFVASAPVSESAMLVSADGSPVEARVERVYTAASGRLCKTITLRGPNIRNEVRVACTDGTGPNAGWRMARPLMAGESSPVFH